MPRAANGSRRTLRARRDGLVREALSLLRLLAHEVEIHATTPPRWRRSLGWIRTHVEVAFAPADADQPIFHPAVRRPGRPTRSASCSGRRRQVTVGALPHRGPDPSGGQRQETMSSSTPPGAAASISMTIGGRLPVKAPASGGQHQSTTRSGSAATTNRYPTAKIGEHGNRPLPWV